MREAGAGKALRIHCSGVVLFPRDKIDVLCAKRLMSCGDYCQWQVPRDTNEEICGIRTLVRMVHPEEALPHLAIIPVRCANDEQASRLECGDAVNKQRRDLFAPKADDVTTWPRNCSLNVAILA